MLREYLLHGIETGVLTEFLHNVIKESREIHVVRFCSTFIVKANR